MARSTIDLRALLPEHLSSNSDYMEVINILNVIFSDIQVLIDDFDKIVDIDNCTDVFVAKLSSMLDYTCKEVHFPVKEQREVVKRLIHVYRNKGKDSDLLDAVNYGHDDKYVGKDLTYGTVTKNEASLIYPIDRLFRHSVSRHSGSHYYADSERWREGVIIISTHYINENVRKAISKVVPAGIRIYFNIVSESDSVEGEGSGINGSISFGEYEVRESEYVIRYDSRILNLIEANVFSDNYNMKKRYRSGRQLMFEHYEITRMLSTSTLEGFRNLTDLLPPNQGPVHDISKIFIDAFKVITELRGIPELSIDSKLSGRLLRCGIRTGEIITYATKYVEPTDLLYNVSEVQDMKVGSQNIFHSSSVEINISS